MIHPEDIYVYLGLDEFGSGAIGIKQGRVPAGMIPLVAIGPNRIKLERLRPQIEEQSVRFGKKIYFCNYKFDGVLWHTEYGEQWA